jgi:hypothetical protein
MKHICLVFALLALSVNSAFADACTESYGNGFTPNQRRSLCKLANQMTAADNVETVAGAGTNQATGAALSGTKSIHRLTGANGTVAWVLPNATAFTIGSVHTLLNTTAGVANIFPAVGGADTINGAAADAVFAALTGIKPIICVQYTASAWICS